MAAHLGAQVKVEQKVVRVDPRVQWSQAMNIWHNAGMRTALYTAAAPFRWVSRKLKRQA